MKRAARFDVYQGHDGEWRWRLYAPNKKIIADSAEGYVKKGECKRAVMRVIKYVYAIALPCGLRMVLPPHGRTLEVKE